MSAHDLLLGCEGHNIAASVIIPKVPSPPINRCFKSYPVLSFLSKVMLSSIVPLGKATLSPIVFACRDPYLI